jgi:hypothetical protein
MGFTPITLSLMLVIISIAQCYVTILIPVSVFSSSDDVIAILNKHIDWLYAASGRHEKMIACVSFSYLCVFLVLVPYVGRLERRLAAVEEELADSGRYCPCRIDYKLEGLRNTLNQHSNAHAG